MSAQILANRKNTVMSVSENGNARVKMYDSGRGWGFCRTDEGVDIFVHFSVLRESGIDTLKVGERVIVEYAESPKGPKATSILLAA
jgi:CspA family cold shock protein